MAQPDAMLLVPFLLEVGGDHVLVDGDRPRAQTYEEYAADAGFASRSALLICRTAVRRAHGALDRAEIE